MNQTIAFIWENYEFGGVTTNIAALINSKKFRKKKIIIFTNSTNQALKKFRKLIKNDRVRIITFDNYLDLKSKKTINKIFLLLLRPFVFFFYLNKTF